MEPRPNVRTIGDQIERVLDRLQARLEPSSYDEAIELAQLTTELYGAALTRVIELAGEALPDGGSDFVRRLSGDDLVASLMIVHGLHPDGLPQRVEAALEGVRPFLAGHGGDVELLDIDEQVGAVHLRLLGSCDGCPSSAITLRSTVERAILDAAPEISIIDVEEPSVEPARTPVSLISKPQVEFDPATGCGALR